MLKASSIAAWLVGIGACSSTNFGGPTAQSARAAQPVGNHSVGGNSSGTVPSVDQRGSGLGVAQGADAKSGGQGAAESEVDVSGGSPPGVIAAVGGGLSASGELGVTGNTAILTDGGNLIACPTKNQSILILDFKSGWWAGDGGNFFQKMVGSLQSACNQKVKIEYHHIINSGSGGGQFFPQLNGIQNTMLVVPGGATTNAGTGFGTAFLDATFASYTQIWVLSGSSADPLDLSLSDPFFLQVVQHAQASKAAFFIGAGYGSISHGNAVATALNVPAQFSTQQVEGDILDPTAGVAVASLMGGALLKHHILFTNGANNLPDDMIVGGKSAHGDAIGATGSVTVIATDNHGQASIAVPDPAAVGRKTVLDADMPRYYAIWQNLSPNALQFLRNVIVYLSN